MVVVALLLRFIVCREQASIGRKQNSVEKNEC